MDSIQFGGTLRRLLTNIVNTDPSYRLVFLSKVDLSNTYMHV